MPRRAVIWRSFQCLGGNSAWRPTAASDASRAAKPNGDFSVLDDDGDSSLSATVLEHSRKELGILFHVEVLHRHPFGGIGLTGRRRIGSACLAEDLDFSGHCTLPIPLRDEPCPPEVLSETAPPRNRLPGPRRETRMESPRASCDGRKSPDRRSLG